MNEYITGLLVGMSNRNYSEGAVKIDGVYESDKTVSWQAYEEARKLTNIEYLDELYFEICQEKNATATRNLYFILKQIAINTQNIEAISFLVKRLEIEKDKDLLVSILSGLGELYKPSIINISNIVRCAENRNYDIRGKAYEALTNSEFDVEGYLEKKLRNNPNINDVFYLISAIKYVATAKSRATLETFIKSRKSVINNAAAYAVAISLLRENISLDLVHKKTGISIETLNQLKEKLSILTRRPLTRIN